MHIAHYTNTYLPVVSGVVRSISTFRKALTELGHNVFIFSQHASDYEDEDPFIFRYPAFELPIHNNFPITIPMSSHIDWLLPTLKLDVIHAHHPFLLGQTAANKADELNLPFVFTFHTRYRDYSHYVSLNQNIVKEVIDRWLGVYMQQCQHIVVPSNSIRDLLAELYGLHERVTVIPTGINLAPYSQPTDREQFRQQKGWQNDRVLISAGRLAKEKSWDLLIEAAAKVIQHIPNTRLVILGEGEEREALQKLVQKLGVSERIELPGAVPFTAIPQHLFAADLFCFASVTETQGLVTLEAMAANLPVVAVAASGTSDVIDHEVEGLLTEQNADDLAQAIIRVLQDDDLCEVLRTAALAKAQTYDIKRQAERLTAVYHQAIADKKADQFVQVDKQKPLLNGRWYELLGLEENPFHTIPQQINELVRRP
ncbi:MAG: glycosyltransferase [Ardenticatenaceae bacterium]|nr:glycosyltransferase [Ardenticatenaceae bacterium]